MTSIKKIDKKEAILEAALNLFASKGYYTTSMSDVAKEAGVAKGSLYNYFFSKENLLEAILLSILDVSNDLEKELVQTQSPNEFLQQIIEGQFELVCSNRDHWRFMYALSLQPGVFEFSIELLQQRIKENMKEVVSQFEKKGSADPEIDARLFIGTLDGLLLQVITNLDDFPVENLKQGMINKYCK